MIKNHFRPNEVRILLQAIYYSKLYYGSEIWHIPTLSLTQNKSFKFASANALNLCLPGISALSTHTDTQPSREGTTSKCLSVQACNNGLQTVEK